MCSLSGKSITARAYEAQYSGKQCEEVSGFASWLKQLKLTARAELFRWRLSRGEIQPNEILKYRKINNDDQCVRGCGDIGNLSHIIVNCKYLQEVLKKIQEWGFFVPIFNSLDECLSEFKSLSRIAPNIVTLYCNAVFIYWKNRNDIAHGKTVNTVSATATNVISTDFLSSCPLLASWGANLPWEFQSFWHPPPQGWIKINVDAALLLSYNVGIGGCFRDDKGRILVAFGENRTHWDIANLELEAVMAVKKYLQPWMMDYKGLIIEGDNINVIKFIQNSMNKAKWQSYNRIEENLLFLTDFNKHSFFSRLSFEEGM
ncbi:uncharacterized protein LOC110093780 [Dendrobium catenatum]|uniref:uncharacterized protein LOC110093780 n=1 Tax=Dendrobium catenatum TaxID=906689 RepID=UPI0009F5B9BD|nr:uncharacterized protein LOC110093780 [Dendrobium catenatum]